MLTRECVHFLCPRELVVHTSKVWLYTLYFSLACSSSVAFVRPVSSWRVSDSTSIFSLFVAFIDSSMLLRWA